MLAIQTQSYLPITKTITISNQLNQNIQPNAAIVNQSLLFNNPKLVSKPQIVQTTMNTTKTFNPVTVYNPHKIVVNQNYITKTFTIPTSNLLSANLLKKESINIIPIPKVINQEIIEKPTNSNIMVNGPQANISYVVNNNMNSPLDPAPVATMESTITPNGRAAPVVSVSVIDPTLINQNFLPVNNVKEPNERLNLAEFKVINKIGEGTFGKIYKVIWMVNNRVYALKKEVLKDLDTLKVRQHRNEAIRAFYKLSHCKGIVNLHGNLTIQNGYEFQYFELMELCDKDFEKEIKQRAAYHQYYSEPELYNIMFQLISTLSYLQKMHITHRDIKPQNILISNGLYKLCDFGDIRVMQREGDVVQRVRGSELYMSPILFKGLREKAYQVRHNTYKSDVFSLGMCFLFAACLSFDGCVEIREVMDMKQKEFILNKHLGRRYSQKIIRILQLMLQTEEINRPDFILLEAAIRQ